MQLFPSDEKTLFQVQKVKRKKIGGFLKLPKSIRPSYTKNVVSLMILGIVNSKDYMMRYYIFLRCQFQRCCLYRGAKPQDYLCST